MPHLVKKTNHPKYSKPVELMEFESYVKESIETKELQRQHQLFPRGNVKPCEYGSMKENKLKNRYNNLVACKFRCYSKTPGHMTYTYFFN